MTAASVGDATYVTLPWFAVLVFFVTAALVSGRFTLKDHRTRMDDVEDREDERHERLLKRLERAEGWLRYLIDDRNRPGYAPPADLEPYRAETVWARHIEVVQHDDQADANPATVPIVIPDPAPKTEPSEIPLLLAQTALDAEWEERRAQIEAEWRDKAAQIGGTMQTFPASRREAS